MNEGKYSLKPARFFGLGLTRVTVWTENGLCYPQPTGKVSRRLEDACNDMRGKPYSFEKVQQLLWKVIEESNENTINERG